jgi:D-3-phosphoglycerate dehydrogenase
MAEVDRTFRVLLADAITPDGIEILRASEGIVVDERPTISPSELIPIIGDYDAIIVRSRTRVTEEVLSAAGRLKVIGRAGVGIDNIDVEVANRLGIAVLNSPGGNIISAAEFTLGLMLALVRHIAQASASLRRGEWERVRFRGGELHRKTLGLVGAGRIGSEVARRAKALGMHVLVYDPYLSRERAEEMGAELAALSTLLGRADVVSIHTPLTEETHGLLGAEELALMKPSAYLVNAARGGVVDEAALVAALEEKRLAGAALDVFEQEPPPLDHPLLKLDNVLAVPHLGAATREAQTLSGIEICKAVRDALLSSEFNSTVDVP